MASASTAPTTPTTPTGLTGPTPTTPLAPATDTTRPLGATEFNNLRSEWTKAFNAAGITDINTINAQIEKNFITRNGNQISLKTNAPSLPTVMQGLQGLVPPKDTTLSTTPTPAASFGGGSTPITSLGVNLAQTTATSIETALAKLLQDQQTAAANAREAAQAQRDKAAAGLETALGASGNEDKLRALNEEMKIKETQASLQQILNQINNYKASLDMGLNAIDNTPIALEFQVGQKAALNRQAASTITALSSQAAVVQNQLQFAQNLVSQYYTAAQQDRRDEITRYQTLYQMANDNLIELKADEKTAIDRQISLLSDINARQMAEKDKIIGLMMSNPDAWAKANVNLEMPYAEIAQKLAPFMASSAESGVVLDLIGKYPDAGIGLNDSLATAQAKLQGSKLYKQATRLSSGGGGGGTTTTDSSIDFYVSDFRNSGLSFSDWAAGVGLDTATKNKIADRLAAGEGTNVIPDSTTQLDISGNQILGTDQDTGEQITTGNIQDVIARKEQELASARRSNQTTPSVMFQYRINELENDLSGLRQAQYGEQLTQG